MLVDPEPEVEDDDLEVEDEVAEEALREAEEEEDFRLAELMVPLVALPDEPVGTMTVLFTPAGMEAAGD